MATTVEDVATTVEDGVLTDVVGSTLSGMVRVFLVGGVVNVVSVVNGVLTAVVVFSLVVATDAVGVVTEVAKVVNVGLDVVSVVDESRGGGMGCCEFVVCCVATTWLLSTMLLDCCVKVVVDVKDDAVLGVVVVMLGIVVVMLGVVYFIILGVVADAVLFVLARLVDGFLLVGTGDVLGLSGSSI